MSLQIKGYHGLCWMEPVELTGLFDYLRTRNSFLEIGSASGVTAALVSREHPDLKITCIDPFYEYEEEPGDRHLNWVKNKTDNMSLFKGTFYQYLMQCPSDTEFDAVLVDGGHAYDECLSDLRSAYRVLKPDGIMFVHDYSDPNWMSVKRAVHRFLDETLDWRVLEVRNSLMVLVRMPITPEQYMDLPEDRK